MSKKLDKFNPDYPYKKEGIDTGVSDKKVSYWKTYSKGE